MIGEGNGTQGEIIDWSRYRDEDDDHKPVNDMNNEESNSMAQSDRLY